MRRVLISVLIAFSAFFVNAENGEDNVLLWMFNDPDIYDFADGGIYKASSLVGRGDAEGLTPNAVRIAVDVDGNKTYLDLGAADDLNSTIVSIPSFDDEEVWWAGPTYASLAKLGSGYDTTTINFIMELGFARVNDSGELETWIQMASAMDSYSNLRENFIVGSELGMQTTIGWHPSMSVPEPNSGILAIIGFCALLMRRKRII